MLKLAQFLMTVVRPNPSTLANEMARAAPVKTAAINKKRKKLVCPTMKYRKKQMARTPPTVKLCFMFSGPKILASCSIN
jgi:hypothetical protein